MIRRLGPLIAALAALAGYVTICARRPRGCPTCGAPLVNGRCPFLDLPEDLQEAVQRLL